MSENNDLRVSASHEDRRSEPRCQELAIDVHLRSHVLERAVRDLVVDAAAGPDPPRRADLRARRAALAAGDERDRPDPRREAVAAVSPTRSSSRPRSATSFRASRDCSSGRFELADPTRVEDYDWRLTPDAPRRGCTASRTKAA